ncbi:hypothetical protein K440DRAFT_664975 [Wilcoxina mikolae CBS 423.85]|nr:hypothetical protein K440DRAFT_664975 [Wilcoxina mikolae CBS 423.85]
MQFLPKNLRSPISAIIRRFRKPKPKLETDAPACEGVVEASKDYPTPLTPPRLPWTYPYESHDATINEQPHSHSNDATEIETPEKIQPERSARTRIKDMIGHGKALARDDGQYQHYQSFQERQVLERSIAGLNMTAQQPAYYSLPTAHASDCGPRCLPIELPQTAPRRIVEMR